MTTLLVEEKRKKKLALHQPLSARSLATNEEVLSDKREKYYKLEDDLDKNFDDAYEMQKALNQIIPEHDLQILRSIGEFDNKSSWTIGDLVNEIYARSRAINYPFTYIDICWYVSKVIGESRSHNTIKGYGLIARRFTKDMRSRLSYEDIPFSHFAYAGRNEFDTVNINTGAFLWEEILRFSFAKFIETGHPISVRQLREEFKKEEKKTDNKNGFKLGKISSGDYSIRSVNPSLPEDFIHANQLAPEEKKNYVIARLSIILQELNGLNSHIVGNIPRFPTQMLSQAIILLGEVLKKTT